MSKKAILTCGYYSLNSAYEVFRRMGFDIIKMRDMPNPMLDEFCIDDSLSVKEFLEKESYRYLDIDESIDSLDNYERVLKPGENEVLSFFGAGGRHYSHNDMLYQILASRFFGSIMNTNAHYDYVKEACRKYNIKALLTHTSDGAAWGATTLTAKSLGIPTFCCYNGTIANYISDFAAQSFYDTSDYYYLHGEYDLDWFEGRRNTQYNSETMPLVGQPSFDRYYNREDLEEPECNTFLYPIVIVHSAIPIPSRDLHVSIDLINYAFYRGYIPADLDALFFLAFSAYQKEVNPSAKLMVALRPYFTISAKVYSKYLEYLGISNFEVFNFSEKPYSDLLQKTKFVVGGASTTLIEACLNRKAILCLTGHSNKTPFRYVKDWAAVAKTASTSSIVDGLIEVTENEEQLIQGCNDYAEYFNYKDDGKAGERLAEDLVERIR